ncbi:MAG: DUF551 domain-containing protein [Clostridiales bacterium]|nr:DUF551 domain-containing protein [Clostridiales bacterium]
MDNDLIRKVDIIAHIEEIKCNPDISKNYGTLLDIIRYIEEMKSERTWIPCSKVMPEDMLPYNKKATHPAINVLATLSSGKVTKLQRIGDMDYYHDNEMSWHWGRCPSGVVAWQPLPEKYVEVDN